MDPPDASVNRRETRARFVALFWMLINGPGVIFGTVGTVGLFGLFVGGGSLHVSGAGVVYLLPVFPTVLILCSLGSKYAFGSLRGVARARRGLMTVLGLEALLAVVCTLLFWSWFQGDEWWIPIPLLSIAALAGPSIWLLRPTKLSDGT